MTKAEREAILQRYPVERFFSTPVAQLLQPRYLAPGKTLFDASMPKRLSFLVEGKAKTCFVNSDGNELLVAIFGPGTIMGDMVLFSNTDNYLVRTVSRCLVIELPLKGLEETLLSDPVYLRFQCRILSDKLERKDMRLNAIANYSMEQQLAGFLLAFSHNGRFNETLTSASQYLGASYRHVQRLMSQFTAQGLVLRERGVYRIADEKGLRALSCGIPRMDNPGGFLKELHLGQS